MDRIRIDDFEPLGDDRFRRHEDRLGLERRVELVRTKRVARRADQRIEVQILAANAVQQCTERQFLHRLVARERVRIALR